MSYDIFQQQSVFGSASLKPKKTLDDLEKDENFLEVSERFLGSIGRESDDVFEYLRDSDFNLVSGMSRAIESGNFNEQEKQDYAYLRREFDNADLGSLKQFAGLVKDASIDIATDPTFIVAAMAAPFTGGTSLASRTAIGTQGLKVAKNFVGPTPAFVGPARVAVGSLKEEGKKAVKKAATVGALEAGAWLGLDNHFRQTTELNTDIRKLYSLPELAGSTTLGVLTGGLVGGGIQKANLYYSKMNRLYSDDEYLKTKEGSLMDKVYKTLEIVDKAKGSVIPIGSATSLLDTKAKFSPTTRLLGNTIREDFDRSFTSVTRKKVELGHGEKLDILRGDYHRLFDEATAPLRKTGAFKESDELAVIRIMRGAKPEKYGAEVQQVAKDLEAFFNKVFDDAVDAGLIQKERKLANYFPRSWNRKAIEDNRPAFQQKLIDEKIVKDETEASNLVDGMLNKRNELFSSHSVLLTQARAFKNLDDNAFEAFLTTDFNTAINYYMNAANTIQHKKSFLLPKFTRKSNEAQFRERFIDPMDKELREARGQGRGLTSSDRKSIIKLYKSVTGQVNYFDSGLMQGVYDATKLANSVAYLPLATVSSLTEALIPLTKTGGSVTGPVKDALKGVAEGHKIFVQDIPGLLKTKYKMKDSDIQKEMQQVFMGMDEAFAESTNRLTGEGLQNEALKKIGRGFFRLNMLTPWTKSVQLASFNIGKGLIRENLEALDKLAKEGVDIFDESKLMSQIISDKRAKVKSTSKIRDVQLLKSELYDLGIDVEDGIRWLNDGAKTTFGAERKDGVLTGEIKYADDFYKSVVQGAGRFVNEVIMPVGRDRARIPVFMTNPKVDILTQFLRYPAVFSNTVLKNYVRSAIVNPKVNGAKMGAFALMTVNMALATNYWRSNKENKDRIVEEGINSKDITKAFARVGLLGPLDYGYRFSESLEYTKNPAVSSISLGGPVMTDTLGLLLGRRGVTETVARKAPLIGTAGMIDTYFGEYFEENPYDELIKKAKEIDKEGNYLLGIKDRPKDRKYTRTYERSYKQNYATGGIVKGKDDVPFTKENPADRKDPRTGKPYSDQMARLGLAEGGSLFSNVINNIREKIPAEARLYFDKVIKQNKEPISKKDFTEKEYNNIKNHFKQTLINDIKSGKLTFDKEGNAQYIRQNKKGDNFTKPFISGYNPVNRELTELEIAMGIEPKPSDGSMKDFTNVFGDASYSFKKDNYENAVGSINDIYDFNFEYGGGFNFDRKYKRGSNINFNNSEVRLLKDTKEKAGILNPINRAKYISSFKSIKPREVLRGNLNTLRPIAERYAAFRLPDEKTAKKLEKEYSPVNVKVDIPMKDIFTKEEYDSLFKENNNDQVSRLGLAEGGNLSKSRMLEINNYLKGKGYSKEARAGILANISVETGDTYNPFEQEKGNSKKGYGLFQLTGKRKDYNNWMKENNFDEQTVDNIPMQLEYMHETIYGNELMGTKKGREIGGGTASKLQQSFATGTPEEIALSFSNEWEKPGIPHNDRRVKKATELFNIID